MVRTPLIFVSCSLSRSPSERSNALAEHLFSPAQRAGDILEHIQDTIETTGQRALVGRGRPTRGRRSVDTIGPGHHWPDPQTKHLSFGLVSEANGALSARSVG